MCKSYRLSASTSEGDFPLTFYCIKVPSVDFCHLLKGSVSQDELPKTTE